MFSKNKNVNLDTFLDPLNGGFSSYLKATDRANLAKSCSILHQHTHKIRKRMVEQLLQAMLDHQPKKIAHILNCCPELLFAKPANYFINQITSQLTGLQFLTANETIFSIVQKLKWVAVLKIVMLPELQKKLNTAALKKHWILSEEISKNELQEKYLHDYIFEPLNALMKDATIQVCWDENLSEARITHLSQSTTHALNAMRQKLLEPKEIQDCVDVCQLLIAAHHAYDRSYTAFKTQHQRAAFAICVIGFIQSLAHPSLGEIYCNGLQEHCDSLDNQAEEFRLTNGRPFYQSRQNIYSGFLCNIFGGATYGIAPSPGVSREARCLEKYAEKITQACYEFTREILQDVRRRTPQRLLSS